jgi:hypothetical protein
MVRKVFNKGGAVRMADVEAKIKKAGPLDYKRKRCPLNRVHLGYIAD